MLMARAQLGLERSWGELWISEPGEVAAVELDVNSGDRECVVLRVGRIERDHTHNNAADALKTKLSFLFY